MRQKIFSGCAKFYDTHVNRNNNTKSPRETCSDDVSIKIIEDEIVTGVRF